MRTAVVLGVLAVMACGGRKGTPAATIDAPRPDIDLGRDELVRDLEATVLENYQQLSLGNIEAYLEAVANDRPIALLGVTPRGVVLGRNPPAARRDRRLYRARNPRILSKNLEVRVSRDGSVGWIYDEISYRVPYLGREASIPIRTTAIYTRDVDRWVQVVEHLSYAVDSQEIVGLSLAGELRTPERFSSDSGGSRRLAASLVAMLGRLHNGTSSGARVSDDPDATVLIWPDPAAEFDGRLAPRARPLARYFGDGATVGVRDYRVSISRSERVAWVVANLVVRTVRNDESLDVGLRGTYVLERDDEGSWTLMQAHVSLPLLERQLSLRVFGPPDDGL